MDSISLACRLEREAGRASARSRYKRCGRAVGSPTHMLLPQLQPLVAPIAAAGVAWRATLTPGAVQSISIARDLFHGSWLLPLGMYLLLEPPPRMFPMSISWTIRRGLCVHSDRISNLRNSPSHCLVARAPAHRPKLVHHSCWLSGWALFVATVLRTGNALVSTICVQMFAFGAVAVIICPLSGTRRVQDAIHWFAALIYIAHHALLFTVLGTRSVYVRGFWACFALMSGATTLETRAMRADGAESASSSTAMASNRLAVAARGGFMLGEYGLFVAFLCGMTSGL